MTPVEAEVRVSRLCNSFRGRMTPGVRRTWADALVAVDAAAADAAIDQLTRTEQRMPTLATVLQAALRQTAGDTQPTATTTWQVLVTWTDQAGLAYAEPRRWHHTETDARADYTTACKQAADRTAGRVELIRYDEGRPAHTVENFG